MRLSLEWLCSFVDIENDAAALAEELTTLGLEVNSVSEAAPAVSGVIVGKVVECGRHPNADKLSLCIVDDGNKKHEVVCGAPNVRAGINAAFAPIGARLPNGTVIKAAKLRGAVSNGMLCSARELGLAEDVDGILVLDPAAAPGAVPGISLTELLALDDAILDINLTPNRGDCFSVLGIAREVAAHRGLELKSLGTQDVAPATNEVFPVTLGAPKGCPRFASRVIRGVRTGEISPLWLRERLRRAGLRAIHPVVDVTNYVMLELGQPLHAYDLGRLQGSIGPRMAKAGETLELLDGRPIELEDDLLVIADEQGPVGLAGIMGGARTAVAADTSDVLFEAAFFKPDAIAGRARRFGLHTDASLRFERGVDPTGQARAIERATALLLAIAGGTAGPTHVTEDTTQLPAPASIALRHDRVNSVLGLELGADEIERLLTGLGIAVSRRPERGRPEGHRPEGWDAIPPVYRFDLGIEEDLIEEVGRTYGYDRIPATTGAGPGRPGTASEHQIDEDHLADLLIARGYSEVITYGFVDQSLDEAVNPEAHRFSLANPISSDMAVMRTSVWPGLLQVARQNLSHQQNRLKIFEIGREFSGTETAINESSVIAGLVIGPHWPQQWDGEGRAADFHDLKADVEALLQPTGRTGLVKFEAAIHSALTPGRTARITLDGKAAGWIGVLHPGIQQQLDLRQTPVLFVLDLALVTSTAVPVYHAYSRFPSVRRDLALVVPKEVPAADVLATARAAAGKLLQRLVIFDVYTGSGVEDGRKSLALGLILQDVSRTLSDADADQTVQSVTRALERDFGATTRSR